jgi:hypothetical protein
MTKLMLTGGISGFHTIAGHGKRLFLQDKGKSCVIVEYLDFSAHLNHTSRQAI